MPTTVSKQLGWPPLSATCRPWTRWWWMGSAVNDADLTRELVRIAEAGLGGVEITPIYPAKGREAEVLPYLGAAWLARLRHAIAEAQRLGLHVDLTTGTGWCFGGPNVSDADANQCAEFKDGRVFSRPSGRKVKRAAPGGEGHMLNLLAPEAMSRYLERFADAFADPPALRALFHDSYEYISNWAPGLPEAFERNSGYALDPAVLFGEGCDEATARVKRDYRGTISGLILESIGRWTEWAHAHGCQTRYQAHGSPGNWLDLYAAADIPETEMFARDRDILVSKFASSAAHVAGKPLVGAETGTWLADHFCETLAGLKQEVDELLLAGVNHIVYHGTCYSPDDAAWPGWLFYAATQMNPRNPIWRDAPALNVYVARCQSVLQSGRPDSDALLYWPIRDRWHRPSGLVDAFNIRNAPQWLHDEPVGDAARRLWEAGIGFDYVSDRQLRQMEVRDGRFVLGAQSWGVLVVPPCRQMPDATAERLRVAEAQGARIVHDPSQAGAGETLVRLGLSFIRRAFDGGWHYFLVNTSAVPFEGWVPLSIPAVAVGLLLDPLSGATGAAAVRRGISFLEVFLQLAPGESVLLRAFRESPGDVPAWRYVRLASNAVTVVGRWHLAFQEGGPVMPPPCQLDRPRCWTELAGDALSVFAGTATYRVVFDAPNLAAGEWSLDLGAVSESARVRLNGVDLGTRFSAPFRYDFLRLKPAGNTLEIDVTSLAANRIRDLDRRGVPWKEFHDIAIVHPDMRPFDASDWPVAPCGLAGPVTLCRAEVLDPSD